MYPPVKEIAVHGAQVFPPLVFDVDQRPLTAAEGKMLKTGKLEEVVFCVHQLNRWQVTPAGREASSTVTT